MNKDVNNNKDIKISFRPFAESDIKIRTKWLNNPAVKNNLGWQIRKGTTLKEQKEWYKDYVKDKTGKRFTIEADGKPVGIVGLSNIDTVDKNAVLYIFIGEDGYRGIGLGRKSCDFIIDFGFTELNLHKIYLEVNGYNKVGIHLYRSLGFKTEGCFKEQILLNNKYYDEKYMGLLRKDYIKKPN